MNSKIKTIDPVNLTVLPVIVFLFFTLFLWNQYFSFWKCRGRLPLINFSYFHFPICQIILNKQDIKMRIQSEANKLTKKEKLKKTLTYQTPNHKYINNMPLILQTPFVPCYDS